MLNDFATSGLNDRYEVRSGDNFYNFKFMAAYEDGPDDCIVKVHQQFFFNEGVKRDYEWLVDGVRMHSASHDRSRVATTNEIVRSCSAFFGFRPEEGKTYNLEMKFSIGDESVTGSVVLRMPGGPTLPASQGTSNNTANLSSFTLYKQYVRDGSSSALKKIPINGQQKICRVSRGNARGVEVNATVYDAMIRAGGRYPDLPRRPVVTFFPTN